MTSRTLLAPARLAGQSVLRSQADERLVDLAVAGSTPAFETIVARYRGPLLGYCTRILGEERAEDAVQQAFIKAHAALGRGELVLKLRPWLYRIAHNTALNALRGHAHDHQPLGDRLVGGESPDHAFERRQSFREVLSAVQALPLRQRDAIVLRELEGRSYEEIARELGVTNGAVRQLLNRARTSVRAGITAVTPVGPLLRLAAPLGDAPAAARVAELCGAGAGGAVAAKLCATALVTGAVAGGVALPPATENPGHTALAQASSTATRSAPRERTEPAVTAGGGTASVAATGGADVRVSLVRAEPLEQDEAAPAAQSRFAAARSEPRAQAPREQARREGGHPDGHGDRAAREHARDQPHAAQPDGHEGHHAAGAPDGGHDGLGGHSGPGGPGGPGQDAHADRELYPR